jgi:hypothetical protein
MELTLASAFSQEGLLGHAAYVLLVISMLMRTLLWLRILVIASAVLGISYSGPHPRRSGLDFLGDLPCRGERRAAPAGQLAQPQGAVLR